MCAGYGVVRNGECQSVQSIQDPDLFCSRMRIQCVVSVARARLRIRLPMNAPCAESTVSLCAGLLTGIDVQTMAPSSGRVETCASHAAACPSVQANDTGCSAVTGPMGRVLMMKSSNQRAWRFMEPVFQ